MPVDRGDHRLGERPRGHVDARRAERRPRLGERALARAEVGARAERGRGAGQHDDADRVVAVAPQVGVGQFLAHAVADGVALLRPVQRDGCHTAVDVEQQRAVSGQVGVGGQRITSDVRVGLGCDAPAPGHPRIVAFVRLSVSHGVCTLTQAASPQRRSTPEIWPGKAYPLGATFDGAGTNFALFCEVAERVELCLFDDDGTETADRRCPRSTASSGTATCPTSARASATATGCTARTTRRAGCGATRPSCCSTRTPRRSTGTSTGTSRCSATTSATRTRRNDDDSARRTCPSRSSSTRSSTGATTGRRARPYARDGHLRGARQGAHRCATPTSRRSMRGTYAGLAHPAIIEHLKQLGRHRVELMPVHQFVHDSTLLERGPVATTGATTRSASSPRTTSTRRSGTPRRAGAGVQGDGAGAARGRHRGDPRRRLQPHRRGQPPGPDAVAARASTTRPTTGSSTTTSATTWTTPAPATASTSRHPHSLQLIMDSLRYWVTEMHVDGFRFDLAVDAGPRVLRRRPAVGVLRPRPAGPGRQPGQADRRAVGRRPGRLPGRQLPAAVDGVERQVPRHRPRLLARRAGHASASSPPGSPARADLYEHDGAPPGARRSTSSPRTTASRCATWCPTTRSTTRPTARTTTTARATTGRGTAASRARPTTPRSSRCGPGSSATSSPRCCCRRACR